MNIKLQENITPDFTKLDDLFEAIGWGRRGIEKWQEVASKSSFLVSAWNDSQLVGFGRILEDGVMCMFYDIGVHPDCKRQGIGKKIMDSLIEQIKDKGYASIGLWAWEENPDNLPFYESLGFESTTSGMELTRYMKPEGGTTPS